MQYLLSPSQQTTDGFRNWNEEIWDTSIGLTALATDSTQFLAEITQSRDWLLSKYLPSHQSWNDELWESLCAINALAQIQRKDLGSESFVSTDVSEVTEWLLRLMNTPSKGMLINWSSTALFVLFARSPELPGLKNSQKNKLFDSAEICAKNFIKAPFDPSKGVLWTPEAWSNGLVLMAISLAQPGLLSEQNLKYMLEWFRSRISLEDLPTEDRAFSCIGVALYRIYLAFSLNESARYNKGDRGQVFLLQDEREKLRNRIASRLRLRIKDFEARPPWYTSEYHAGYYSLNLPQKATKISIIVSLTILLSYLTWKSQPVQDGMMGWLILIPIVGGALATIAQLTGFSWKTGARRGEITTSYASGIQANIDN
jgi:hypothetical protein